MFEHTTRSELDEASNQEARGALSPPESPSPPPAPAPQCEHAARARTSNDSIGPLRSPALRRYLPPKRTAGVDANGLGERRRTRPSTDAEQPPRHPPLGGVDPRVRRRRRSDLDLAHLKPATQIASSGLSCRVRTR